jgi:hypothetical protein
MSDTKPIDGVEAVRAKLNADLLKLSEDLSKPGLDYEFTLTRISDIAKTLKRLPKEEVPKEKKLNTKKEEAEENKSIFDKEADSKR